MPTQPYVGSEAQGVAVNVGSGAIKLEVQINEIGVVPMQPDGSAEQGVGDRGVGVAAKTKLGQNAQSFQSRRKTWGGFLLNAPTLCTLAGEV